MKDQHFKIQEKSNKFVKHRKVARNNLNSTKKMNGTLNFGHIHTKYDQLMHLVMSSRYVGSKKGAAESTTVNCSKHITRNTSHSYPVCYTEVT